MILPGAPNVESNASCSTVVRATTISIQTKTFEKNLLSFSFTQSETSNSKQKWSGLLRAPSQVSFCLSPTISVSVILQLVTSWWTALSYE